MRYIATLIALVAVASVASAAAVGSIDYIYDTVMNNVPDGSQGGANEWTVNQISLETDGLDWVTAELIVTPGTTGQIYQYFYLDRNDNRIDNDASISQDDVDYDGNAALWDTFITDELLVDGAPIGDFSFEAPTSTGTLIKTGAAAEDALSMVYYHSDTDNIGAIYLAQVTINVEFQGIHRSQRFHSGDVGKRHHLKRCTGPRTRHHACHDERLGSPAASSS